MSRQREPMPLGDGPASEAARMMGLSPTEFEAALPRLFSRQFPQPDSTTGKFDLDAIKEWRKRRHPRLFTVPLAIAASVSDANEIARRRLAG